MNRLAARLRALEQWDDEGKESGEGLAALLAAAQHHGITTVDWTDTDTDEETGLAVLLRQAREERQG